MHLLSHFTQENCSKCEQSPKRIDEIFYILHSAITRIEVKRKKAEEKPRIRR